MVAGCILTLISVRNNQGQNAYFRQTLGQVLLTPLRNVSLNFTNKRLTKVIFSRCKINNVKVGPCTSQSLSPTPAVMKKMRSKITKWFETTILTVDWFKLVIIGNTELEMTVCLINAVSSRLKCHTETVNIGTILLFRASTKFWTLSIVSHWTHLSNNDLKYNLFTEQNVKLGWTEGPLEIKRIGKLIFRVLLKRYRWTS